MSDWFWNRIAVRYSKTAVFDEESYQHKLTVTRRYLHPYMEVLEIGCGTGSTAIIHAPYVKHIHAIDSSYKMIEIAQGKAKAANINNVTFEELSIDQLKVEDDSLDIVLGLSILHLLKNREEVIARLYKMLKPGGYFVTSTACLGDMSGVLKTALCVGSALRIIPLMKIFTRAQLVQNLQDAGFIVEYNWQPAEKNKATFIIFKKNNIK